jgi:hypothetical protein
MKRESCGILFLVQAIHNQQVAKTERSLRSARGTQIWRWRTPIPRFREVLMVRGIHESIG